MKKEPPTERRNKHYTPEDVKEADSGTSHADAREKTHDGIQEQPTYTEMLVMDKMGATAYEVKICAPFEAAMMSPSNVSSDFEGPPQPRLYQFPRNLEWQSPVCNLTSSSFSPLPLWR